MPVARFQMPDGRIARFEVPEGTTPEQAQAMMVAHFEQQPAPKESRKGSGSDIVDASNAVGTGYNRSLLALLGLPTDAVANVVDLGKAAAGFGYRELTGKPIPQSLEVNPDRSNIVGTRDWLLKQTRKTDTGRSVVDPVNPEYEGGYLQAAGGGLGAIMNPNSRAQLVGQGVTGVTSALASKAAYDATGNPALAITAGMVPTLAQNTVTAATKYAIRGGEKGRQKMEQRVQDLNNAGVDQPTLGLASGNELIGGVENLLQSTPGAVKVMRQARDRAVAGLQSKTEQAASAAAKERPRGNAETGAGIRADISGPFLEKFKSTQRTLYDKLDQYVEAGDRVGVDSTKNALQDLTNIDQGAPNLSAGFVNTKIQDIRNRFDMDTGAIPVGPRTTTVVPVRGPVETRINSYGEKEPVGPVIKRQTYTSQGSRQVELPNHFKGLGIATPVSGTNVGPSSRTIEFRGPVPTRINSNGGQEPVGPVVGYESITSAPSANRNPLYLGSGPGPEAPPELPYGAIKKLRTDVGNQLSNELLSGAPDAQWKRLYAGMSEDMKAAANAAGPDASKAWSRANDYTSAGMNRLERVRSFADKEAAPESIYNRLVKASETGSSTLQAVKKSLTNDTRGQMAGTVIEQLGKATDGRQNAAGNVWSPETFLTNWNKIKSGRSDILSGFKDADKVRAQVESVAEATSMMRDNSKMWANPSGTAANIGARAALGAIGGGLFLDPTVSALAAGGMLSSNALARGLTSKWAVDSALRKNNLSKASQATAIRSLLTQQREDQ